MNIKNNIKNALFALLTLTCLQSGFSQEVIKHEQRYIVAPRFDVGTYYEDKLVTKTTIEGLENSVNNLEALTNNLEWYTWIIQDPTNGVPYPMLNPWPRDVTIGAVKAKQRTGTNEVTLKQCAFNTAWDAASVTIEADIPVTVAGTTDSAISGTATVSNGDWIIVTFDIPPSIISITNVAVISVGVKP